VGAAHSNMSYSPGDIHVVSDKDAEMDTFAKDSVAVGTDAGRGSAAGHVGSLEPSYRLPSGPRLLLTRFFGWCLNLVSLLQYRLRSLLTTNRIKYF
jgi:hypothetical protein